jgi:hypothetical protein
VEHAHHDLGVDEVFGTAEGDEADFGFGLGGGGGFEHTCGFGLGRGSHSLILAILRLHDGALRYLPLSLDLVQSIHFWWFRFGLGVVIASKVMLFDAWRWQSIHFKIDKARLFGRAFVFSTISFYFSGLRKLVCQFWRVYFWVVRGLVCLGCGFEAGFEMGSGA